MENKVLSYAPAECGILYCGSAYPAMVEMASLLKQQICVLCSMEEKSIDGLSQALGVDPAFIGDAVNQLMKLNMLKKSGDGFKTNFCVFTRYDSCQAYYAARKLMSDLQLPAKVDGIITGLKDKIAALDFYGHDFDIKYLNWILYILAGRVFEDYTRRWFSEKSNIIVLDADAPFSEKYPFSLKLNYQLADDKRQWDYVSEAWECWSTFYDTLYTQNYGTVCFNNIFDAPPFENSIEHGFDRDSGRGKYYNQVSVNLMLKLAENPWAELLPGEKEALQGLLDCGFVVEEKGYRVMIPVFTQKSLDELNGLLRKELSPLAKMIVEKAGPEVEKILLPVFKNDKELKDQFYAFWASEFIGPIHLFVWYGLNKGGFAIPADYKKSAAGIYMVQG